MALASLRHSSFTNERIDVEQSVVFGVRLAEVGKVATFAGKDGKPRSATITKAHADAFLSHAGNRSIPVHWTHDYLDEKVDRLHAKVGALKNFRFDESGNPIADLHIAPSKYKDTILWGAKEDPENMMLSAVFSYDENDETAMPLDLQAADLVEKGAATTALFSQAKPNFMTKEDIEKLVSDSVSTAVTAALAAVEKPEDEKPACDAAEVEAGVTDEDKEPEDEAKPAALRAAIRINRATARLTSAALTAQIEKADGKTAIAAMAELTKQLGTFGKFSAPQGDGKPMTRAAFSALTPSAQSSFCASGGKISD